MHTPVGSFYGRDTLEGFARDAEFLAQKVEDNDSFDNDFHKLCVHDNLIIFELKDIKGVKLDKMTARDLDNIIDKELKNGKARDLYGLTPEHLKHCGVNARKILLNLINSIIEDMYHLSCPQVKAGLGTAIYKGKKKPVSQSSSYRRITVTTLIGSILDRYIDPLAEFVFRPQQNSEQYGFTQQITYLMAAFLRGECQRWAIDTKQTCFGISFDGKAAFPSVDRDIQVRELYACGESGDLLDYSRFTYMNTTCIMK